VRASGSTSLHLSQHAAILTPGSSQVLIPIATLRAMAFVQTVRTRRVSDLLDRFIPAIRLSQQYSTDSAITGLQCSLYATAC
jgi:hypothetical protein